MELRIRMRQAHFIAFLNERLKTYIVTPISATPTSPSRVWWLLLVWPHLLITGLIDRLAYEHPRSSNLWSMLRLHIIVRKSLSGAPNRKGPSWDRSKYLVLQILPRHDIHQETNISVFVIAAAISFF